MEKRQTDEGGSHSGVLTNKKSKSFLHKNDGRGNGVCLWPAENRNQGYNATSHEASTAEMSRTVRPLFKH